MYIAASQTDRLLLIGVHTVLELTSTAISYVKSSTSGVSMRTFLAPIPRPFTPAARHRTKDEVVRISLQNLTPNFSHAVVLSRAAGDTPRPTGVLRRAVSALSAVAAVTERASVVLDRDLGMAAAADETHACTCT